MSPSEPHTKPQVLIIGAGVAGVSCALWLRGYGLCFDWVDSSGRVGGTLARVHHAIANYPGAVFRDGADLAARLQEQVDECGLRIEEADVEQLSLGYRSARIRGEDRRYRYLVLATGTRPRRLGLPAEEALEGTRVFVSTHHLKPRVEARRAIVVGGGDGAFEGALVLARAGAHVEIVHRSRSVRARRSFREQVEASPRIRLRLGTHVTSLEATDDSGLVVGLAKGESGETVDADYLVRKIGVEPYLPALDGVLARVVGGYVKVDASGRTSAPGVFAAGDLASPHFQCVAGAAAQGALVAKAIADVLLA